MSKIKQQNNVICGNSTLFAGSYSIAPPPGGVEFGNYCAIAPNLIIKGVNHDYNFPCIQNSFYKNFFNCSHPIDLTSNVHSKGKITIGNDVWIGEHVYILSGVTIGDGCCIGAKSVVTKSLPPYSICVGTPCKDVKKRYSNEMINFLLELKWWNWSEDKIKRNKIFFMTNLNKTSVDKVKKIIIM